MGPDQGRAASAGPPDEAVIRTPDRRLRVFVSSTLGELAFADGDPGRAALLEGAAQGLRRRVGLPAWPHLRRVEGNYWPGSATG